MHKKLSTRHARARRGQSKSCFLCALKTLDGREAERVHERIRRRLPAMTMLIVLGMLAPPAHPTAQTVEQFYRGRTSI